MGAPTTRGTPRYRRASPQDAAALARLAHAHHGGDLDGWAQQAAETLRLGEQVLVATDGEAVLAYAKAGRRAPSCPEDPAPAGWYLTGLVVTEAWRRQGVARRLVRLLLAGLAADGRPVWSIADAANDASVALHADLGFREVLRAPCLVGERFRSGEGVLFRSGPG